MNLASMLQLANTPPRKGESESRKKQWQRATLKAREEHTSKAVQRYKEAMQGSGWLTQAVIEQRLGYASTVSTAFLKKLREKLGLIDRRNRDGSPTYNRMRGYEWKWKEENE